MKHDISNSCGKKRGCAVVITLPYDSKPWAVFSALHGRGHDIQAVLPVAYVCLDKKLEEEAPLAALAA